MRIRRFELMRKALGLLSTRDKRLLAFSAVIQILLSFLDLIGVALIGALGALAVNGVQSRSPGTRVGKVLELLNIDSLSFQSQATVIALLASGILLSRTILSMFFARRVMYFLSLRGAAISHNLFSRLLNQNVLEINRRSTQETIYALTSGVSILTLTIIGGTIALISDLALLVVMTAGLFVVDYKLAITTFIVFLLVVGVVYKYLYKKVRQLGESEANLSIRSNDKISEILTSYRENVARGRRAHFANEIARMRNELAGTQAELSFLPNISKYFVEATVVLGTLIICAVQFQLQDATRAVGTLSVFLAAGSRIAPAVLRIQQAALAYKGAGGSLKPTLELIDSLKGVEPIDNSEVLFKDIHTDFVPEISLKDVSFKYPDSTNQALRNVSLYVKEGETVAIVGASGAGKTTLVDVILGILTPLQGDATISGLKPLEAISKWPGAISYVPQDVMIAKGSILENVSMGFNSENAILDNISHALQLSQLEAYVESLPESINSLVGERGTKLSGGQRQRLGIARALYTKPRLLVLDEATSALDGKTESDISDAMGQLRGKVTLLVIAHRLSTIKHADRVYYLEKGELRASGTFDEVRSQVPDFDAQAQLMGL